MSEAQFWRITPRKLSVLIDAYCDDFARKNGIEPEQKKGNVLEQNNQALAGLMKYKGKKNGRKH